MMRYRERIYSQYVTARHEQLAPKSIRDFRPFAPYLRKLILNHFPKDRNARIIELGCGHGSLLYFSKEAGYADLTGIDRSPEQVAAAHRMGIPVREGDLVEALLSFETGTADAIVALDVLEHFTKTEVIEFVDHVARVLKPGGRLILHVPNGESPFGGASYFNDFTHEICFHRNSVGQLLLSSGFSEVRCFEDQPIPRGLVSAIRWVLWKIIRIGLRVWTAVETGDPSGKAIYSRNLLAIAIRKSGIP